MLIICGTIPLEDMPLTFGRVRADGDSFIVGDRQVPCTQGTGAMIRAALSAADYLKTDPPHALLAGDIGLGTGSREIYEYLIQNIAGIRPDVLALHYWLPDMPLTRRLCAAVDGCAERPVMIADAASMYSAKAAGLATAFDVFTPDASELAFLADPAATHPAYIKKHLFNIEGNRTPELIRAAYQNGSAAKLLLVKGAVDYVVKDGNILETVAEPDVPAMEAIGGTGDTISGLIAAFVDAGIDPAPSAMLAARANRAAGQRARATPATKISRIIEFFPDVFKENLCQWTGVCVVEGENDD
ncbi:MAG: sugar kinase [Acidobacteria bacterium]|nr:sugar kinase [Acidobacteriota bacterium]